MVYADVGFLARGVATWIAPSLHAGGGAILVGTVSNLELVRSQLRRDGVDVDAAERAGRLLAVEADWLMARFMLDGTPEGGRFASLAKDMVGRVRAACEGRGVRAWGEMVDLLRERGNAAASLRLEALWSAVIEENGIALLCSYERVGPESDALLADALAMHDRVLPEPGTQGALAVGPPRKK